MDLLYHLFIFPLEQILGWALFTTYKALKSHGLAVIVLSLLLNLFLLRIFLYTDRLVARDSALQEKLNARIKSWKKVYKRAKLYAFTRTLYRQNNYHPIYALRSLGGLALQIPFFWAMFLVVEKAEFLTGASFLWIEDLSLPDEIAGVHLLPLLMTLFTLINVFCTSKNLGARVQGVIITLAFLLLLYESPAALVLYWTTNMAFSLAKTLIFAKRIANSSSNQAAASPAAIESMLASCVKSNSSISHLVTKYPKALLDLSKASLETLPPRLSACVLALQKEYAHYRHLFIWIALDSLFMMLIFSPYQVFASDLSEFDSKIILRTLVALLGFVLLCVPGLIYLVSFFYHTRIFKPIVTFFMMLLLAGFSYTFLLTADYGPMSYFIFANPLIITPLQQIIDGVMVIVSLVAGFFLVRYRQAAILLKVLFVVLVVGSIVSGYEALSYAYK